MKTIGLWVVRLRRGL